MYHPNDQSSYLQSGPYQQSQSHQTPRSFQQQQFGPRFQIPSKQFTPPRLFYQSHQQLNSNPKLPYQGSVQTQPLYQPSAQNNENPANPQYPSYSTPPPIQNFNKPPPIQNYNQPPPVQNYNQPPPIQIFNQPPPIQNFNQPPPIQNYNQPPPIQNYNQPPPIQPLQNYNQHATPSFQSTNQNCHQPINSPYQGPSQGYCSIPNTPYQPQVQSPDLLKQPYQQQSLLNLPRHEFNQRLPFRLPGQQRFNFRNQNPRYQQLQHYNNNIQFQPRQQYQNYHPRGSFNFNNKSKENNVHSKGKLQIACEMGDCDFVGHAGAIKEHQNLHHKLGLHKQVLYSNNSEAVKKWIEERKKKWPTKETILTKIVIEDEKLKRGERIVDEDFQKFNNKNNKFNGSKRFNNRKRPFVNEFKEPTEEPMNGNLKRFAGIVDIQKEIYNESNKPVALKLLEEYDESSENQSDSEPPEEIATIKETAPIDNKSLTGHNKVSCSTKEDNLLEHNLMVPTSVDDNDSKVINTKVEIEKSYILNKECKKSDADHGLKRKKNSNKESNPRKKNQILRTSRTEIVERQGALLETLMGDLMRRERNAITQCICYVRNNMQKFNKIQAV